MLCRLEVVFGELGLLCGYCVAMLHCPGNGEKALHWRLLHKRLLVAIGHLETTWKLQMVEMWYVGSMRIAQ